MLTRWICYPIPGWTSCDGVVVSWEPIRDTIANRSHWFPRKQLRWPCTESSDNCRPCSCSNFLSMPTAEIGSVPALAAYLHFSTISIPVDWHGRPVTIRPVDVLAWCCDAFHWRADQRLICGTTINANCCRPPPAYRYRSGWQRHDHPVGRCAADDDDDGGDGGCCWHSLFSVCKWEDSDVRLVKAFSLLRCVK